MNTMMTSFLKEKSFENYSDESALAFMLEAAGVRNDIHVAIENLLDAFGSFKAILEARPEQLMKVSGVSRKMATLISTIVPMARVWERCLMEDEQTIMCRHDAEAYARSLLMGERTERFYVIALNARCKLLGCRKITEGSLSEVSAYPRIVVETALMYNAHSVLLAHNHPGGSCTASSEDVSSTVQIQQILKGIGIKVLDHIIVAGSQTYSLVMHGDM